MNLDDLLRSVYDTFDREECDTILYDLCRGVIEGQRRNPEYYGMVAACVLGPNGERVYANNHATPNGQRVHAERSALDAYAEIYGRVPKDAIIITTLSPCSAPMDDRYGLSCTQLIDDYDIRRVYCGYKDPTQSDTKLYNEKSFEIVATDDSRLRKICQQFADTFLNNVDEDYDPNGPPPGPEFPPTMPAGTVRVDVSDVYDWYKLGQHISNLKGLGKHDFGKGPPSSIISFGDEDTEHKFIDQLRATGLDVTDIDPADTKNRPGAKIKTDPTYNVDENFADGKGPGRPGDSQRHGIPKGATIAQLEKAAKASGRKGQLARWQLNMRRGKKK
jgi:pyrimidine deaminase RibD-like protein